MKRCIALLLICICSIINGFPDIEKIELVKKDGHICWVSNQHNIEKVTCENCQLLVKENGGYRIKTVGVQLLIVHIKYNGMNLEVPFSLNCNINSSTQRSVEKFQVKTHSNSLIVKLEDEIGFTIIYMDRKSNYVVNQSKAVSEYAISGLLSNTRYQICVSGLNKDQENGPYRCIQTNTGRIKAKYQEKNIQNEGQCRDKPLLNYLNVRTIAYNLIQVKWNLTVSNDCEIGQIEFRLYEKGSKICTQQINVGYTKGEKTLKTKGNIKNETNVRNETFAQITSGAVHQYWSKRSVHVEMTIFTKNKTILQQFTVDSLYKNDDLSHLVTDFSLNKVKCYADCLSNVKYTGIRSQDIHGRPCGKWSDSSKYSKYKVKSNWCYSSDPGKRPWCPTGKNKYANCDIPQCEKDVHKVSGCVKMKYMRYSDNSIYGEFVTQKSALGYLLMLHSESGNCLQFSLYGVKKFSVGQRIRSFFHNCPNRSEHNNVYGKFVFFKLKSLRIHTIYIIPIDGANAVGNVTYYSQLIQPLQKPGQVGDIEISLVSRSSMKVSWKEPAVSRGNGYVQSYKVVLKLKGRDQTIKYPEQNVQIFDHLKECMEYCVIVTAINDAGSSVLSRSVCKTTLQSNAGSISVRNIENEFDKNRLIRWSQKSKKCNSAYRIVYWVKYGSSECKREYSTSKTHFYLEGLQLNTPYEVQVHSDNMANGGNMVSSNIRSFFTGAEMNNVKMRYSEKILKHKNNRLFQIELRSKFNKVFNEYELLIRTEQHGKCIRRITVRNVCQDNSFCGNNSKTNSGFDPTNLPSVLKECSVHVTVMKSKCRNGALHFNLTTPSSDGRYFLEVYGKTRTQLHSLYQEYKGSGFNSIIKKIAIILSIAGILFLVMLYLGCRYTGKKKRRKVTPPVQRLSNIYDE